ncbi:MULTISPECIES: hypothetical protein [unclassified Marinovum]
MCTTLAQRRRIAKLQTPAFGTWWEKVERDVEQLELALGDMLVAVTVMESAKLA